MAEGWVQVAVAEQDEHIKRVSSCAGQLGRSHRFADFGGLRLGKVAGWSECFTCGVTETAADYATKTRRDVTGFEVGDRVVNRHAPSIHGVVVGHVGFVTGRRVIVEGPDGACSNYDPTALVREEGAT